MNGSTPIVLLGVLASAAAGAQDRPSVAPKSMQAVAPGLAAYTDRVLFGDVWLRPELKPRDRSLVTLSVLVATGRSAQLAGHLNRGLTNGLKPSEISGMVTHLAFYTGWPNAVSATEVLDRVFTERKVDMVALRAVSSAPPATTGRKLRDPNPQLTAAAPKLEQLTADVIFADLWRRTDLTPRDRSLVTIAALAANGDDLQLASHIRIGLDNGLTRAEVAEAITHLAFYAGWAKANSALRVAVAQFAAKSTEAAQSPAAAPVAPPPSSGDAKLVVTPSGQNPDASPSSNFAGSVVVTSRFKGSGDARLGGATVRFAPGAHTNWHSHPLGQLLIVTAGRGWVQADGEPVRAVGPGDIVWTAPGVRHWHGATRTTAMTHTAVSESKDGASVTWMEPVTDAQYRAPR